LPENLNRPGDQAPVKNGAPLVMILFFKDEAHMRFVPRPGEAAFRAESEDVVPQNIFASVMLLKGGRKSEARASFVSIREIRGHAAYV
jgi:hypothetical protein